MTNLEYALIAMKEDRPALWNDLRKKMCSHPEEEIYYDKSDGVTSCILCGAIITEAGEQGSIEPYDRIVDNSLTQ